MSYDQNNVKCMLLKLHKRTNDARDKCTLKGFVVGISVWQVFIKIALSEIKILNFSIDGNVYL